MHNDVGASSSDLVRMGHGVECESRVSLRVVYTVASVCVYNIRIQVKVSMACGGRVSICVLFTIIC